MIENVYRENGIVQLADVGGSAEFWSLVPSGFIEQFNVKITVINLYNGLPPKNKYPFNFIDADGCNMTCFQDKLFNIVHSNSVIEHVGGPDRMQMFANEIKRIGAQYFVQTPNYGFPIEPHCLTPFFHWLPENVQIKLVCRFSLGHWRKGNSVADARNIVHSARMLKKNEFSCLFDDANILTERFCGFAKSFIAIRT